MDSNIQYSMSGEEGKGNFPRGVTQRQLHLIFMDISTMAPKHITHKKKIIFMQTGI